MNSEEDDPRYLAVVRMCKRLEGELAAIRQQNAEQQAKLQADLERERELNHIVRIGAVRGFEQIDYMCQMIEALEVGMRTLREQAERQSASLRVRADDGQDDLPETVVDIRVAEQRRLP